jgi:hypothetical protein
VSSPMKTTARTWYRNLALPRDRCRAARVCQTR